MNRRTQVGFLMILVVAAIATLVFVILPVVAGAKYSFVPAPAPVEQSPDQVTQDFYAWYIDYAQTANPLVNKAYRDSDALTRDFVAWLDEFTAQPMMFDPILCAQDVPSSVATTAADVSGATATVRVETSFAGHAFDVRLTQEGGAWKIAEVICSPR